MYIYMICTSMHVAKVTFVALVQMLKNMSYIQSVPGYQQHLFLTQYLYNSYLNGIEVRPCPLASTRHLSMECCVPLRQTFKLCRLRFIIYWQLTN